MTDVPAPSPRLISIWPQLISIVEAPLLLLLTALYVSEAGPADVGTPADIYAAYDTPPWYLTAFLYVAALAGIVCCGLLVAALIRKAVLRAAALKRANLATAVAAAVGVAGDILLNDIWRWTRGAPPNPYGGDVYSSAPTLNGVIEGVLLAVAAGALAAVVPVVVLFLLDRHAAPETAPS